MLLRSTRPIDTAGPIAMQKRGEDEVLDRVAEHVEPTVDEAVDE